MSPQPAGEAASAEQPSSGPQPIRSARQLHQALRAPDPAARLRVLKAVAAQPEQALAFGLHGGRDVIAVLLELARRKRNGSEWHAIVAALGAFRDPRVTDYLVEVLGASEDSQALFLAAHGLRDEPVAALREALAPLLVQDESVARARAAARVLGRDDRPSPALAVRLALIAEDGDRPVPGLDDGSAPIWLRELAGAFPREARSELERQGEEAFACLCSHWDSLDPESQAWLVAWGAEAFPLGALTAVERALASGSEAVILAALEAIAAPVADGERRAWPPALRAALVHLADHPQARLRLAAIEALGCVAASPCEGDPGVLLDWRERLGRETDPRVRRACARRLVEAEGIGALDDLLALLRDGDWRMRATAAEALTDLGEPVLPRLEPLLDDADLAVRVGAAKVLLSVRPGSPGT